MIATVSTSTSATVGFGPGRSPTPANHAVLALGTNVGSLVNNVREAVAMLESEGVDAMGELSAAALKSRDLTYQRHAQQRSPTQHSEADGGDMS